MERGNTLLELVVVMLIASLLSAIALPSYLKYRDVARSTEAVAVMGAMSREIGAVAHQSGGYPPDVQRGIDPGIDGWRSELYGSLFDYDDTCRGDRRSVWLVWFGVDGIRQTDTENPIALGDDRVVVVGWDGC